jgi:hypothetical protein
MFDYYEEPITPSNWVIMPPQNSGAETRTFSASLKPPVPMDWREVAAKHNNSWGTDDQFVHAARGCSTARAGKAR